MHSLPGRGVLATSAAIRLIRCNLSLIYLPRRIGIESDLARRPFPDENPTNRDQHRREFAILVSNAEQFIEESATC